MVTENKSMQKAKAKVSEMTKVKSDEYENKLYKIIDHVDGKVLAAKNRHKSWKYGWNPEHDFVCISKDGTVGAFYVIQGLVIGIPKPPKDVYSRSKDASEQYWEIEPSPDDVMLKKIKSTQQLKFLGEEKQQVWEDFINQEWDRREDGHFFMNEGEPCYITGSHYFYLRWAKIDVGNPDFRDANRIFFYFWEACKADQRAYGMCYLKNRRSGFSFMSSSETVNLATRTPDSSYGILSKTGADAKSMFTNKVVRIATNLPFFFMPIRSGESKPKTEILFAVPSTKLTKRKLDNLLQEEEETHFGLDTKIDWKNTGDNSYDGEKLKLLVHDESGKWEKPNNVINNWNVTKTCLILGSKVVGKCMMGSTCNKQSNGGEEFKEMYESSDLRHTPRNDNGETPSGLYSLFIPMEWNVEGRIDVYGKPVFEKPEPPRMDPQGDYILQGVIDWWNAKEKGLRKYPAQQNEFIRQFPRTENHAFRDEINGALFNIAKINQQIDHNDNLQIFKNEVSEGQFYWKDGIKDGEVEFRHEVGGRFKINWFPTRENTNKKYNKDGKWYPGNDDIGAFGCDSYDIDGVNYGVGSNGALHGLTGANTAQWAPSMRFFLEYVARPQTSFIFFEDVLMACHYYGMPILVENNKPGLLRYMKNRGYEQFCMLRPDKRVHELGAADLSTRGIPNTSEDVKQMHAGMIESYVEEYIGEDQYGETGYMPFNRTLNDWIKFDIKKRTEYDATISSGLAIMAVRKHLILPRAERTTKKIEIPFGRYNNHGNHSTLK